MSPLRVCVRYGCIQYLLILGQHFGDLNEKWSVFGITTPSDDKL